MFCSSACPDAVACLRGGDSAPELLGKVCFFQRPRGVLVTVRVTGLPRDNASGFFALHIHQGGSCAGEGFSKTGSHYTVREAPHPQHSGDLPPLLACGSGMAFLSVLTDRFRVSDVIGRTVVIHSGPDDFHTQPAGNAGAKIACGVIH